MTVFDTEGFADFVRQLIEHGSFVRTTTRYGNQVVVYLHNGQRFMVEINRLADDEEKNDV